MAFAALGATEVLAVDPRHGPARDLLADAIARIGPLPTGDSWLWPEPRRLYANAVLPEALVAAGDLLGRPDVVEDGLSLLRWLLHRKRLTVISRRRRSAARGRTITPRRSTNNRSRSRRSPMPAPRRCGDW